MKRFNENAYNVRKNVTIFQLTVQTNHWPEFTGVRSADRRLVLAVRRGGGASCSVDGGGAAGRGSVGAARRRRRPLRCRARVRAAAHPRLSACAPSVSAGCRQRPGCLGPARSRKQRRARGGEARGRLHLARIGAHSGRRSGVRWATGVPHGPARRAPALPTASEPSGGGKSCASARLERAEHSARGGGRCCLNS